MRAHRRHGRFGRHPGVADACEPVMSERRSGRHIGGIADFLVNLDTLAHPITRSCGNCPRRATRALSIRFSSRRSTACVSLFVMPTLAPSTPASAESSPLNCAGSGDCTVILARPASPVRRSQSPRCRAAIAHRRQHDREQLAKLRLQRLVLDEEPTIPHIAIYPCPRRAVDTWCLARPIRISTSINNFSSEKFYEVGHFPPVLVGTAQKVPDAAFAELRPCRSPS